MEGKILLTEKQKIDSYIKGRKDKQWFLIDNKKYLFKAGASNYEIFAELLACELAKQCNIETAEYYLAMYNFIPGVLSPNFLKPNDIIISGDRILENAKTILKENNLNSNIENSIEGIEKALNISMIDCINVSEILEQLLRYWAFDGLILESDRNATNWSIIRDRNGKYRMAPLYDYSTMCRMNNNIDEFIPKLNGMMSIGSLIDNINYSLTIDQDSKSNDFLLEFERFCNHYPELASNLLEEFNNINVDEAIKRVEKKINGNIKIDEDGYVEFPWQASIWINKVINYRLFDMNNIYEKTKNVGIKGKN